MAFAVDVNMEQPDHGPLRGRQEDVACDCWFSSTGTTIPRLIKYKDSRGMICSLGNIQVRETRKLRRCGIPMVEYKCTTQYEDREYRFRLIFQMEVCQWKLIWEGEMV